MKQGFTIPLREEDHNWCTWIIGEVEHDKPTEMDLGKIIRKVSVVYSAQDEEDAPATIVALVNAFTAAGLRVTFIRDAELEWPDL